MNGKTFTGRHMALILVSFFGVVIAVNLVMATLASRTFGGLVVQNSYVESQRFNSYLEAARQDEALGWTLATARLPDGRLALRLADERGIIEDAEITALARHPLGRAQEHDLRFAALGEGRYESREALPAGRWIVHVEARAAGGMIRRIVDLQ